MTTRCEYALALAEQGFYIHQLSPNSKEPVPGIKWLEARTRDAAVIRLWFDYEPDMNYGVSGGNNGVVIDADLDPAKGKDGEAALQTLEAEHGQAITWSTFTVQSPKGGKHYYLKDVDHVGNAHSFPFGIDVRGENGYVVGPGCHTEDDGANTRTGDYVVECPLPVASAPIWTSVYFQRGAKKQADSEKPLGELDTDIAIGQARAWLMKRDVAVQGENGDEHTYATACGVKDFGISELKCMELLVEVPPGQKQSWNDRCDPPWEIDGEKSLSEKIYNAYHYGTNRPGSKGGALMEDAIEKLGIPDSIMPSEDGMAPPESLATPDAQGKTGFDKIAYRGIEFAKRDIDLEMVIYEWLPAQGLTAILADRGTGKTVTMLDQALRLACDRKWHVPPTAKDWVSIYLCGEGDTFAQLHFQAWLKYYSEDRPAGTDYMAGTDGPAQDRFMMMTGVPNLLDANDVKEWTKYMNAFIGDRRAVVYLDTWQRASSHGSQNDDVLMQTAFHNAEAIARSLKGPIVAAFHPPKHSRDTISGAYALENNTTTIQKLERTGDRRSLKLARTKGTGEGHYMSFDYQIIETGQENQFGKKLTGIVPVYQGGQPTSDTTNVQNELMAREATRQAFAEALAEFMANRGWPNIKVDDLCRAITESHSVFSKIEGLEGIVSTNYDATYNSLKEYFGAISGISLKRTQGKFVTKSRGGFDSTKFFIETSGRD